MKTAVSLPDPIYREADRLAKQLGISRSELYARALAAFLERQRGAAVTAALNRVYADGDDGVDPLLRTAQRGTVADEEW